MKDQPSRRRLAGRWLRCTTLALFVLASTISLAPRASGAASGRGNPINVHPRYKFAFAAKGAIPQQFPPPSACFSGLGIYCYTPALINSAYGHGSTWTGKGQTIVIVDAFGAAGILPDLDVFSKEFGLPEPNKGQGFQFNVLYPQGLPVVGPGNLGSMLNWEVETELDVQWAHALAPLATIDLVVSRSNYTYDLLAAQNYAVVNKLGGTLSESFGQAETNFTLGASDPNIVAVTAGNAAAAANHVGIFVSAGDAGSTEYRTNTDLANNPIVANTPASDPNVTAVAGTDTLISDIGALVNQQVWNDDSGNLVAPLAGCNGFGGATGGAPSRFFPTLPSYQVGVPGVIGPATIATSNPAATGGRNVADVAINASGCTAVLLYLGPAILGSASGFYFIGGTSEGAPMWAAIAADANQSRAAAGKGWLGLANPCIYSIGQNVAKYASDFTDVTVGDNSENSIFNGNSLGNYTANAGYDIPSGWGSPKIDSLIGDMTSFCP